jgi:hypothetical protein
MAATMACHAAVKANDPLTREKNAVFAGRIASNVALVCLSAWTAGGTAADAAEIERNFERI